MSFVLENFRSIGWGTIADVLALAELALAIFAWRIKAEARTALREKYIRPYVFPDCSFAKLREKHAVAVAAVAGIERRQTHSATIGRR
jgi:hypothetical protein